MAKKGTQKKQSGIYIILNKELNKVYVGQTKNFKARVNLHKWKLNNGLGQKELNKDWQDLGSTAFEFKFLWEPQEMDLTAAEQLVLNLLSQTHTTYNKRKCTNPSASGKGWKKDKTTGKFFTLNARSFKSTKIETQEEKIYPSIKEAVADGHNRSSVLICLSGKRKCNKGFTFEYIG